MSREKKLKIKLSRKLFEIAKLVEGDYVADVGCDHGKLSIYLALTRNSKIYACDLREKPLKKAEENAKSYGVFERIDFVLSDGLKNLPYFVDCVVVAGMGGKLIENIIFDYSYYRNGKVKFILQPQSFLYKLRRNLCRNGFRITKEVHLIEKGKCYDILEVRYFGEFEEIGLKEAVLGKRESIENLYTSDFLRRRFFKEEEISKGLKMAKTKNIEKIEKQKEIVKILKEELAKIKYDFQK